MTEIHIRISIAHEHLASLPPGETRARNALIVLDRFTRGEATHHQLGHAAEVLDQHDPQRDRYGP